MNWYPKKMRGTIKPPTPISSTVKGTEYNFVFSSDIADWQSSRKKKRDQRYKLDKRLKQATEAAEQQAKNL